MNHWIPVCRDIKKGRSFYTPKKKTTSLPPHSLPRPLPLICSHSQTSMNCQQAVKMWFCFQGKDLDLPFHLQAAWHWLSSDRFSEQLHTFFSPNRIPSNCAKSSGLSWIPSQGTPRGSAFGMFLCLLKPVSVPTGRQDSLPGCPHHTGDTTNCNGKLAGSHVHPTHLLLGAAGTKDCFRKMSTLGQIPKV